jgi:hypothetical protein
MRPTVMVLCAVVLVLSGCAGQKAARSSAQATTPTTRPVALDGCVRPGSAQLVDVGGGNQAAVLGTGPVGVVLSNQSDQSLCGWLPFAKTLAGRGFRALVYDYGITGDPAGDVAKAAAKFECPSCSGPACRRSLRYFHQPGQRSAWKISSHTRSPGSARC